MFIKDLGCMEGKGKKKAANSQNILKMGILILGNLNSRDGP